MSEEIENMLKERFKVFDEQNVLHSDAYNYLSNELLNGREITVPAYKFLCWLYYNNSIKFPIDISQPHISVAIDMSNDAFAENFCINEKRNNIYAWFIDHLIAKMEEFNVCFLDVLIGGSFIDECNESPNDIDCVILIDKLIMTDIIENSYDFFNPRSSIPVDVEYVVKDSSFRDYWYYNCFTHLGNKVENKELFTLRNEVYKKRQIVKVRVSHSQT